MGPTCHRVAAKRRPGPLVREAGASVRGEVETGRLGWAERKRRGELGLGWRKEGGRPEMGFDIFFRIWNLREFGLFEFFLK